MTPSSFSYRFRLPAQIEEAFALLSDPRRLDHLTPPWFRLRMLDDAPKDLTAGIEISYRLSWRGLPWRWTSRMTSWKAPHSFTYEQRRGPYRHFRHEHLFAATDDGTEIVDRVDFRAWGGKLVDRLIVRPDLERIFVYRERRAAAFLRDLSARRLSIGP